MEIFLGEVKKKASEIGWKYAIVCTSIIIVQFIVVAILNWKFPELSQQYSSELSFLLIIFSVDFVGFGLLYFITKGMPITLPQQHNMSLMQVLGGVMIGAAIVAAGNMVGTPIHYLLMLPYGLDQDEINQLSNLMMNSNALFRILAVGIGAPIFEELIFRKFLIDRVLKYGEVVAILLSGLMFGIFHGNFQQFFFSAALGFFFAYIYVRTGKIWYTMLFHMIINMSSSVVTVFLLGKFLKASELIADTTGMTEEEIANLSKQVMPSMIPYYIWMGLLFACVIGGVIVFIRKRQQFFLYKIMGIKNKQIANATLWNPGMILFYIMGLGLFLITYLSPLFS